MRYLKKVLLGLLLIFLVMQLFRPDKYTADSDSITPFLTETNPPDEVVATLKQACFDCHSNATRYPWYNAITPVNYWLKDHIDHGKEELNVSEWSAYSVKRKDHKLEEIAELVEEGEMPLQSYTWTHADARLSDEQVSSLINWVNAARSQLSVEEE